MDRQLYDMDVPGQFIGSSIMVLAVRRGAASPMRTPAVDDLAEMLEDRDEYLQRAATALQSPFTRDILDGAVAASMLGPDGEDLIPLFGDIIADCHRENDWLVIEPVEGVTLKSTLFMIEVDLLMAVAKIGSPLGVPLARRALSDIDDCFHTFAIGAIKAIGPAASEVVFDLLKIIQTDEPSGVSDGEFQYHRSLRRDACEALGAIGSPKAKWCLHHAAKGMVPNDVRDAAIRATDEF